MATTSIWRVNGWLGKVVIYVENPKAVKRFGKNQNIKITNAIVYELSKKYGEDCVKVIEKGIANLF